MAALSIRDVTTFDQGVTHVALPVTNLDASLAFYERYATMQVVHRRDRSRSGNAVAWISDLTRPFILVLIEVDTVDQHLGGTYAHIGLGVDIPPTLIVCAHKRAWKAARCSVRSIQDRPSGTGATSSTPTATISNCRTARQSRSPWSKPNDRSSRSCRDRHRCGARHRPRVRATTRGVRCARRSSTMRA